VLLTVVASRLVVFAAAAAAQLLDLGPKRFHTAFGRAPLHWLTTWDGHWYKLIAEHGYLLMPGRRSDPAFFPLLPIALRGLHGIGVPYDAAGLAITNAAFVFALLGLYLLSREWLSPSCARWSLIFAALFPGSVVLSMVYPESIALACMAFAGVFAARSRWLACAACCALATFARPEGALLVIPIAVCAVRAWPTMTSSERGRALAAVMTPFAALATVSFYFSQTLNDPLAWSNAERAWGRSFDPLGIVNAVTGLMTANNYDLWLVRDAVFFAIYLTLLTVAWRRGVPKSWVIAGLAMIVLPLTSGSFASDARFGLMALPTYPALALAARKQRTRTLLAIALALLLIATVLTLPYRYP